MNDFMINENERESEEVICNICHKFVKKQGIGSHKRLKHGIRIKEKTVIWEQVEPIMQKGGAISRVKVTTKFEENLKSDEENLKLTSRKLEVDEENLKRLKEEEILNRARKYL
jgi:uncharacterized radical SAM superfamily protein